MPFTADQTVQRQAVIEEETKKAERKRQQEAERESLKTELNNRLKRDYPQLPEYDRGRLWNCAASLTNGLVSQYTKGDEVLKCEILAWAALFRGELGDRREEAEKRLAILTQMARSYNDIGQTFSIVYVGNSELPHGQKSSDPQVRVICTAQIQE
jgi:hypothetical protein